MPREHSVIAFPSVNLFFIFKYLLEFCMRGAYVMPAGEHAVIASLCAV